MEAKMGWACSWMSKGYIITPWRRMGGGGTGSCIQKQVLAALNLWKGPPVSS